MQEGLRAVELVNKKHLASASAGWAKLQLPKPSVVLADMHADPYNIDAQLTGLISLRQYTIVAGGKELLDVMLKPGTSDDSTAGCSYSHTEPDQHAAWRGGLAPKIISREEGDGSSGGSSPLSICDSPTQRNGNAPVTDGSDSPGRSNGKAPMAAGSDSPGRGKAKMVAGPQHNTQSNSPLPIRGNSGGGGAPDAQPVDLVDVIVSAMLLVRCCPINCALAPPPPLLKEVTPPLTK